MSPFIDSILQAVMVEGLIYGLLAMGVFMTFRILDFPDLTVDGSFTTGAAAMAVSMGAGIPLWLGFLIAFFSGAMAGTVTAFIHNKLKVPGLLASILTMTMLYSINMRIMGKANYPVLRVPTLLKKLVNLFGEGHEKSLLYIGLFLLIILIVIGLLTLFFHTDLGLMMGAMGNNEQLVITQGMNPEHLKIIGLSLSNGLVALTGAYLVQYQKFADINMGVGIIIVGLASVMLGEFLIPTRKIHWLLIRAVLGSIVYKGLMFLARTNDFLQPTDFKLISGVLIILILIVTNYKKRSRA